MLLLIGRAAVVVADEGPPEPPYENPHPPVTAEDKRRVAFAERALKAILLPGPFSGFKAYSGKNITVSNPATVHVNVSEDCLKDQACVKLNAELATFVKTLVEGEGVPNEIRHAHVIPWSFKKFQDAQTVQSKKSEDKSEKSKRLAMPIPVVAADEYLIHVYLQLAHHTWMHADVIVNEGPDGTLRLRGFFIVPIVSESKLPPGVKC